MIPAIVALLAALVSPAGVHAADVPYLTGRVVDNAQILSPDARSHLATVLRAHEDASSNQIVVLTVPTIQSEGIEEYATEVFNNWKLGRKGQNNGVLVVVVPQDRRMRIEVGYGLEPVLTDAMAGERLLFVREDAVDAAWAIVDPILDNATPVHPYAPRSWGPVQSKKLTAALGGWHNPT